MMKTHASSAIVQMRKKCTPVICLSQEEMEVKTLLALKLEKNWAFLEHKNYFQQDQWTEENNFLLELMTLVTPKIQKKPFKFGIRTKYYQM